MKKLTFYEMVEMLEIYNNSYYDFHNAKITYNNKTYNGTVFRLDKILTAEQKAIFEMFPNVKVGDTTCVQMSEFHKNCIFLSDTKFID